MARFPDPLVPVGYVAPSDIKGSLQLLGEHLREARLRRNMTLEQVAQLLGVTRRTVSEAERGNPATGAGVYVGVLWALGIGDQLADLATAEREGVEELSVNEGRKRARPRGI